MTPTGDVWCSVGWGDPNEDGVRCYTPDGDLLGKIHIPETVANLCFGGQQRNRLYICGSTSLYAVYTSVQGAHEAVTSEAANREWRVANRGLLHYSLLAIRYSRPLTRYSATPPKSR